MLRYKLSIQRALFLETTEGQHMNSPTVLVDWKTTS